MQAVGAAGNAIGGFLGGTGGKVLGMGLPLVGSVLGGASKNSAAKQARDILYQQARDEEAAGNQQALMVRDQARKAIGEQVAGQFANGFEGGTGSALDALTESQVNAAMDVMRVRREAQSRAMALRSEGDIKASEGSASLLSGIIGGASGAIGMIHDWASAKAPS